MKRWIALLLALCLLPLLSLAEDAPDAAPAPADNLVVTKHTTTIDGKTIDYTATTGTVVMDTDMGQYEIFMTAYTLDGVEDPSTRPITFAYNGGPGSASLWLHMGALGPERVKVDDNGKLLGLPTLSEPNEYSLLDVTDLVLIDPVGTGYSRVLGDTDASAFYSYSGDISSVSDFIRAQ